MTIAAQQRTPELRGIKQQPFDYVHDFVGQEFREGSDGLLSLVVGPEGVVRCRLGLQAAEGLMGLDSQGLLFAWLVLDAGSWL